MKRLLMQLPAELKNTYFLLKVVCGLGLCIVFVVNAMLVFRDLDEVAILSGPISVAVIVIIFATKKSAIIRQQKGVLVTLLKIEQELKTVRDSDLDIEK